MLKWIENLITISKVQSKTFQAFLTSEISVDLTIRCEINYLVGKAGLYSDVSHFLR